MTLNTLSAFGLFAVAFTLVCYMMEARSHWWTLGFAFGCVMGSVYGFAQGAWPFGLVEAIWTVVALSRWWGQRRGQAQSPDRAEPIA